MVVLGTHFAYFSDDRSLWITFAHDLGGKAAVLGFMLVSGYSIAASLQATPRAFYLRRFLRIYPLYITAVLLTAMVEILTHGHVDAYDRSFDSLGWATGLGNAFLLQTFVVKPMSFNTPLWSLSVEVFFYLCAPLFIKLPPRWQFGLVVFSLVCFILPQHEDLGKIYFFLSKFNALRYMWAWLLGFMLWHYRHKALSVFALGCGVVVIFHEHTPEVLSVATYLVAVCAILIAPYNKMKFIRFPGVALLGDLSYPLYLFHYPVLIAAYFAGLTNTAALLGLVLGVTLLTHLSIDRHLKPRYLSPLLKRWCSFGLVTSQSI